MKVSSLYIYPIKSLQGISLKEAEVLERGFKHDRRWMLVNEDNSLITQRTHPHLSQVSVSIDNENIVASYKGMPDMEVPLVLDGGKNVEVKVWNDHVAAHEAPSHINEWFSEIIGDPSRLVFMKETAARPANPERAVNNENVSFADGYPYLLLGESSLADLNKRLESQLPMNRFRPNIVFTGGEAFVEDQWRKIEIGDVQFHVTHPCKRCIFTTIDQDTGQIGKEPLKTLATYRRDGNDVIFGVNTLALTRGIIKVGDPINTN